MLSETTKAKAAEKIATGSSHLCPNLRQEQRAVVFAILARQLSTTDPRMAWIMAAHFVGAYIYLNAEAA